MGAKKHGSTSAPNIIRLVCPHCDKVFTGDATTAGVQSNYRRHILIHTGERPYKCSYCQQGFTTNPNLRRHITKLHAEQVTPAKKPEEPVDTAPRLSEGDVPLALLMLPAAVTAIGEEKSQGTAPTTAVSPVDTAGSASAAQQSNPTSSRAIYGPPEIASAFADGTGGDGPSKSSSARQPQGQPAPPATYTCPDCELELSSRAKLRRHHRYYCPFRDNIFADPVQDALDRYRGVQHCQEGDEEEGSDNYSARHGDSSAPTHTSSKRQKHMSVTSLTEEEKAYLTNVATQSGLKFVEDAYASDSMGSESEEDESDLACYFAEEGDDSDDYFTQLPVSRHPPRNTASAKKGTSNKAASTPPQLQPPLRLSPKHTPLHGPSRSPAGLRPSHSPAFVSLTTGPATASTASTALQIGIRSSAHAHKNDPGSARETSLHPDSDNHDSGGSHDGDGDSDVNPEEDLLHLHYHRRGSGRRRERHILQKRLRAQEGALLELADSPLRRPLPQQRRIDRTSDGAAELHGGNTMGRTAPNAFPSALVSGGVQSCLGNAHLTHVPIVLTEQLVAQADSLVTRSWRQGHRNKVGVSSEFICPYCDDFIAFANHQLLSKHCHRVHPRETVRSRARTMAKGPRDADDDGDASEW